MIFQINGLSVKNLLKAENSSVIAVDIIANHLTEDTENETVLKEAFNPETVKEFLDIGVLEFWHESRNPNLTKEEKNAAIIGKPVAFRWEKGLPIVTAHLTKSHPIVVNMLPHLEANQPVYAASLGGSKVVLEAMDGSGRKHRIIPKIRWDHLAIAPSNTVINREPGLNVRLLKKANDILCEFDNMNIFSKNTSIANHEEVLMKALMAPGSVADMQVTSGGVIARQDLERNPVSLTFNENESLDLLDTILGIKNKKIPLTKAEYIKHFESQNKKDFGDKSFRLIDKYFKSRKER
jgi:hypothetical protein